MIVNPGIRRFLGSAIQRLFNSASFYAPLTHTAVPVRAAPGTTATFTRATTSTWQNNDGYMVTGVAGEIGFVGARRVRNLLGNSEYFAAAYWAKSNVSISASNTIANPIDGALTADTLTASAGNTNHFIYRTGITVAGTKHMQSWYVKYLGHRWVAIQNYDGGAVQKEASFDLLNGVVGAVTAGATSSITPLGNSWYRISLYNTASTAVNAYSALALNNSDSASLQTWNATGTESVGIWGAQLEDVTAQTTQTAGEYVSVGVESAPYYHGSFVDGVACFDYYYLD